MNTTLMLENVTKRREEDLFNPISLTLSPGEGLGLTGYNGSGKTTLLDIISGIERPTGGKVQTTGQVGYVMQHCGFQESLSFKDNLLVEAYLSGLSGSEAARQVEHLADRLAILPFWKKRYSKGSSGMRGRLSVACALLSSPQILLLDEVYNFLDETSIQQTRQVLLEEKERGATLVMVSHDLRDFEGLCERVLCLPSSHITPLDITPLDITPLDNRQRGE